MNLALSQNGYSYVHGNPINYVDPSGEFLGAIAGGILAGARIGAVADGSLAYAYYQAAKRGKCGCELQRWANSLSGWDVRKFVAGSALSGGVAGGISGGLIASGALGRAVAGAAGIGFGIHGLLGAVDDILSNGRNI